MNENRDALAFEAPFLIDKLLKEGIAETREEGRALFEEVKKFIVLSMAEPAKHPTMYSRRIDEAWHQFILYTHVYTDFCMRFFGRYAHHAPANAPSSEFHREAWSFEEFAKKYEAFFNTPLPELWKNERNLRLSTRIMHDSRILRLLIRLGMAEAIFQGTESVSGDERVRQALQFIAKTDAFYVRELPNELNEHEKIMLVSTLVSAQYLRVV